MTDPRLDSATSPSVSRLVGTQVGRYTIRLRLGSGGMGEVYRADDPILKRPVAIKRLPPHLRDDPQYRQRFMKEAERASALNHPHIAAIYDVLEAGGEPYLVMEYVEGVTLRTRFHEPLPLAEFLKIALGCAEALAEAHQKLIVHRDIKPENIVLTSGGEAKVLDFGVARRLPHTDPQAVTDGSNLSVAGGLSGTLAYMAPEVLLNRESDGRSDIFSLGIVFYEALAGQHPFQGDTPIGTTDRILHREPEPLRSRNPAVPPELERIVAGMLAKDPARRTRSAADLVGQLRALVTGEALPNLPRARRDGAWKAALGAALAGLVALAVVFLPQMRHRMEGKAPAQGLPVEKSLVVLPFRAIGGAPQDQVYCDGLTETLTAKLTPLTMTHDLLVAPASEVRVHHVDSAEEARKELGGTLMLSGTFYRSGDMVRVNCELVDTRTLRQLRAETITARVADPFALQDRVVEGVARMLALQLNEPERRDLERHGTQVAEANDLYLQGLGYLQNYQKPENVENALHAFQRAVKLDGGYAPAYAGLGDAYWKKYNNSKDPRWIGPARQACEHAESLDPELATAHLCLGTLRAGTGEPAQGVAELRRALQLDPSNDAAVRSLASAYAQQGELREAEQTYLQAIRMRPRYWANYSWLGVFYHSTGRFDDAVRMFEKVTELAPDNHRGYYNLGAMYYLLGRWTEAEKAYKKSLALQESGQGYSNLGTLYFFRGRYAEAVGAFEKAVQLSPQEEQFWGNLADAYRWAPGESGKAAGAYRHAMELAEDALRVNPRDAWTLADLALYRAKTGQGPAAAQAIERAAALAPRDPSVDYYAAQVYYLQGDRRQSLARLAKALQGGYPKREILADPELKSLHSDPGFRRLVGNAP
jgi:tetratricopeptide (TPR) repeat protein